MTDYTGLIYKCGHIQNGEKTIVEGDIITLKMMGVICPVCETFQEHRCLNKIMDGTYECDICYPNGIPKWNEK